MAKMRRKKPFRFRLPNRRKGRGKKKKAGDGPNYGCEVINRARGGEGKPFPWVTLTTHEFAVNRNTRLRDGQYAQQCVGGKAASAAGFDPAINEQNLARETYYLGDEKTAIGKREGWGVLRDREI